MNIKLRLTVGFTIVVVALSVIAVVASGGSFDVLVPKGVIAEQQRDLMVFATILMLLIVVPVFWLTAHIAWKYRASNPHAGNKSKKIQYTPDWDSNNRLEAIWWGFPTAIILILSVVIWQSSHALDPYRPIASDETPLKVQVVALQWKWLFIYPQYNIATVNHLQLPTDRPVNFEITADAPMNSFWIPQLGGQVYAMAGMTTQLHLIANEAGTYRGSSANLSGEGFANMKFNATATSEVEFDNWVKSVKQSANRLTYDTYDQLAKPSLDSVLASYASTESDLHATIISKYGGNHGVSQQGHDVRGSDGSGGISPIYDSDPGQHSGQGYHKSDGQDGITGPNKPIGTGTEKATEL